MENMDRKGNPFPGRKTKYNKETGEAFVQPGFGDFNFNKPEKATDEDPHAIDTEADTKPIEVATETEDINDEAKYRGTAAARSAAKYD